MPGSEGGDRVHKFFDQEKISHQQSQLQPQVFDGSGLDSNGFHWPETQRHESSPLNFSPGHTGNSPRHANRMARCREIMCNQPFCKIFHGRGQTDGPVTMNSQSHGPQRYSHRLSIPSPRNLPDTVQCLSL